MRYAYAIPQICVLISSLLCQGADITKKITAVKNPTSIIALDYAHCVIAGDRCVVFNFLDPEKSKVLDKTETYHIAINGDQARFAISSKKKLAVYSAFTCKKLWQIKPIFPNSTLAFSSVSPILFAYSPGQLTSYNYVNQTLEYHNIPSQVEFPVSSISHHPTQNKLLYPSSENTLSTIDFDKNHNITLAYTQKKPVISGTYSPDGNWIAINNDFHSYSIYEPDTHFCYCTPPRSFMAKIIAFAFHPHRPILAILFDNNTLRYINYKTKELIGIRMHSTKIRKWVNDFALKQRLSFMFDGKKLMIAFKHKCLVLSVPQNNLALIYYALKHNNLIHDIIYLIFGKFARSLNLHSINLIQLGRT